MADPGPSPRGNGSADPEDGDRRGGAAEDADRSGEPPEDDERRGGSSVDEPAGGPTATGEPAADDRSTEELRRRVEERYDFDDFGPADMADMDVEEWEAVFDADSWITGSELLDRVEAELRHNVHRREVFAVVERVGEGEDDRLVAYSDEGYVIVRPDGSIQGTGTIMRDVEPMVALSAMESYEVPDVDDDAGLPDPATVPEQSGDLGNLMLQVVAGATALSGLSFVLAWVASVVGILDLGFAGAIVLTMGVIFLVVGLFLFVMVANARLSDRMRSAQYRDRLRSVGAGSAERPAFIPEEAFEAGGRELEVAMAQVHREALEAADREDAPAGDDRPRRGNSS